MERFGRLREALATVGTPIEHHTRHTDFLTTLGYPCEKLKQKQNSGYPRRSITTINTTKNHAVDPQMQNRDGAFRISKSQFSKKYFFSSHFLKIEIFQKS